MKTYCPVVEVEGLAEEVDADGSLVSVIERVVHEPTRSRSSTASALACTWKAMRSDVPGNKTGLAYALVTKQYDLSPLEGRG